MKNPRQLEKRRGRDSGDPSQRFITQKEGAVAGRSDCDSNCDSMAIWNEAPASRSIYALYLLKSMGLITLLKRLETL